MRIAVPATAAHPDAPIDARFGRAPYILVYDTEADNWAAVDNTSNVSAAHGAGIATAEAVIRSGATVLITAQCGPKAHALLSQNGVQIIEGEEGTAAEAVRRFHSR